MSKVKVQPEHRDALNRILALDDVVAVAHHNRMMICRVTKLNNKMIKIKEFREASKWATGEYNVYSNQAVKVEGPEVTMFLLSK